MDNIETKLQSSIVLRIIDSLGVFTKSMPDIRNEFFKVKDENAYAAMVNLSDKNAIITLYCEAGENKYMVTRAFHEKKKTIWYCLACFDYNDDNPDLNQVYTLNVNDDKYIFSQTSFIEKANLLVTFECIRNFFSGWEIYSPSNDDLDTLYKFKANLSVE